MRKTPLLIISIVFSLIILLQPSILNPIISFVFVGVIPGTEIVIPFWVTLLLNGIIGVWLISWLANHQLFIGDEINNEKVAKEKARVKVLETVSNIKTTPRSKTQKRSYKALQN